MRGSVELGTCNHCALRSLYHTSGLLSLLHVRGFWTPDRYVTGSGQGRARNSQGRCCFQKKPFVRFVAPLLMPARVVR